MGVKSVLWLKVGLGGPTCQTERLARVAERPSFLATLHLIQDIEDRCLLLTSFTSFVDLPFQEHQMTGKHHMDQNPCISSICPK
jgi:hypothetical protein